MIDYLSERLRRDATRVYRMTLLVVTLCTLIGIPLGAMIGYQHGQWAFPLAVNYLSSGRLSITPENAARLGLSTGAFLIAFLFFLIASYMMALIRLVVSISLALERIEQNTRPTKQPDPLRN